MPRNRNPLETVIAHKVDSVPAICLLAVIHRQMLTIYGGYGIPPIFSAPTEFRKNSFLQPSANISH